MNVLSSVLLLSCLHVEPACAHSLAWVRNGTEQWINNWPKRQPQYPVDSFLHWRDYWLGTMDGKRTPYFVPRDFAAARPLVYWLTPDRIDFREREKDYVFFRFEPTGKESVCFPAWPVQQTTVENGIRPLAPFLHGADPNKRQPDPSWWWSYQAGSNELFGLFRNGAGPGYSERYYPSYQQDPAAQYWDWKTLPQPPR